MAGLTQSTCTPCRDGAPALTDSDLVTLRPQVPDWQVLDVNGIRRIRRTFTFKDFRGALEFTMRVGELAESEQHHPDIHLAWGKVMIESWTHKIRGLHENDFILAAKIDALYLQPARA